jgi:hypothetical protein
MASITDGLKKMHSALKDLPNLETLRAMLARRDVEPKAVEQICDTIARGYNANCIALLMPQAPSGAGKSTVRGIVEEWARVSGIVFNARGTDEYWAKVGKPWSFVELQLARQWTGQLVADAADGFQIIWLDNPHLDIQECREVLARCKGREVEFAVVRIQSHCQWISAMETLQSDEWCRLLIEIMRINSDIGTPIQERHKLIDAMLPGLPQVVCDVLVTLEEKNHHSVKARNIVVMMGRAKPTDELEEAIKEFLSN